MEDELVDGAGGWHVVEFVAGGRVPQLDTRSAGTNGEDVFGGVEGQLEGLAGGGEVAELNARSRFARSRGH
ncbi:hypothetical protein [Nocardia gipuzkoensis]|uniref:hypothetical protein n=1 Tax=Nocardia gipuzkoensis TaxID=2749991 RepID=UPI0015EE6D5E|nr:hypothetical protein [Nocardia gipuzkoensis]